MIKSFGNKETENLWNRFFSKKFPPELQRLIYKKLLMIDSAKDVNDLRIPPGNRLHVLSVDRKGFYSISINLQWRICFDFRDGDAYLVEIVDYH
ncbi:MAG: type II toxin-antitoxin system RelE/ParE family toxin [Leptospiraceae bacterium]|nr:type II toxin-antitoxin system RelE/ParE family toxin [Leptospiraceae bacterium]MCP5512429.1 type II toxin-antitoxin system RelE/ParE family toxin [Leptospiraceae bacterium]